jgi:hypothetical protein
LHGSKNNLVPHFLHLYFWSFYPNIGFLFFLFFFVF